MQSSHDLLKEIDEKERTGSPDVGEAILLLCRVMLFVFDLPIWSCGCGHINAVNLAVCARCGRKPGETS